MYTCPVCEHNRRLGATESVFETGYLCFIGSCTSTSTCDKFTRQKTQQRIKLSTKNGKNPLHFKNKPPEDKLQLPLQFYDV